AITGATEDKLRALLNSFRAPEVSFLTPSSSVPLTARTTIDISHEALIRRWSKIADRPNGWLQKEFRDGLIWRLLVAHAEQFLLDSSDLLSDATAQARSSWIKTRNEAWARRYGGRWGDVIRLVNDSIQALDARANEQRERYLEKLKLETYRSLIRKGTVASCIAVVASLCFVAVGLWGQYRQKQQDLKLTQQRQFTILANLENQIAERT